jgi:DnaJ family protein A protein 2
MFSGGFRGFDGFGGYGDDDAEDQTNAKKDVDNNKYYELLGVEKTATIEEIRKAFRRKALKEHPDKGGDPEKFKELSAAYEVLSNPEKKQLYDDYGEEGVKNGGPPGGSGFGGLFDLFTGGRGRKPTGPRKGKPKLIEMQVTLEEIYNGAMKTVKLKR